jgi:tetratricopeptide (TPR) repeat protein
MPEYQRLDGNRLPDADEGGSAGSRLVTLALGVVLVAGVWWAGSAKLDAPWIQGDERIFIANNGDVTGAAREESLGTRLIGIFLHRHEDLYQPLPIASYAIEWELWGPQRIFFMRQTDVLLHAATGLLLWSVLSAFLRQMRTDERRVNLIAWGLAFVWALHPTLATAFAADMGRTHILSALLALLALRLHIYSLNFGRQWWMIASFAALLLAMMSKVIPAWFLVVFATEAVWIGWPAALRSWRVWLSAVICAVFAWGALVTTRESGILEDAQLSLFGDPISRSLVGVWYYVRSIIVPIGLATWYPPNPDTGWTFWMTWAGAAIAIASLLVLWRTSRSAQSRTVAVGLVWFWAALLPLLGLVGARTAAAQDRYLYMPLMGLMLAAGAVLATLPIRPIATAAALGLLGGVLGIGARQTATDARDLLARAERAVRRDARDPRTRELTAMAYGFIRDYPETRPNGMTDEQAQTLFVGKIQEAADCAWDEPRYFRDGRDRAAFHRRLSWRLLENGKPQESLRQAKRAAEFDPDAPMTLLSLARAHQRLGDWRAELEAFQRLEKNLPDDPAFRAIALTEYGDLLLSVFERPDIAMEKLRMAQVTGRASTQTMIKLARCEVLAGQGATGFQMAESVRQREPRNVAAWEVIAMYFARSGRWEDADGAYRAILSVEPTNYEALRGFHEVCIQRGELRDAMLAWQDAARLDRNVIGYRSFFVWAAACAADPKASEWADELLAARENDRFACLAKMLCAVRADKFDQAVQWIERAATGPGVPRASEFARAEATLRFLAERGDVGATSAIPRAKTLLVLGQASAALETIDHFLAENPDSAWKPLANAVREAARRVPTSSPAPESQEFK